MVYNCIYIKKRRNRNNTLIVKTRQDDTKASAGYYREFMESLENKDRL